MKRLRSEGALADWSEAFEEVSSSSNTMTDRIEAACKERNFEEVVKLGLEGLMKQMRETSGQASLHDGQGGKCCAFDQAVKSCNSASLPYKVVAHHMQNAKAKYSINCLKDANQALLLADSVTKQILDCNQGIKSMIKEVKTQWHLSYIYLLPNETLLDIFAYLSMADLLSCSYTNTKWASLIKSGQLLSDSVLYLDGTLAEIDRQWEHCRSLEDIKSFRRLFLRLRGESYKAPECYSDDVRTERFDEPKRYEFVFNTELSWESSQLGKTFPFANLIQLDYASENAAYDDLMFNEIKECKNLKIHWNGSYDKDNDVNFVTHFMVEDTPLKYCRLEELDLAYCIGIDIWSDFYQLLCEAKRLSLSTFQSSDDSLYDDYHSRHDFPNLLLSARETLEEMQLQDLSLGKYESNDIARDGSLAKTENKQFVFLKLTKLVLDGSDVDDVDLQAPNLKELVFKRGMEDNRHYSARFLLQPCMANLVKLHFDATRQELLDYMTEELIHNLPQCQSLTLEAKDVGKWGNPSNFDKFWFTVKGKGQKVNPGSTVPRLQYLVLDLKTGDVRDDDIVSFIQSREAQNMPRIALDVGGTSFLPETCEWLKGRLAHLSAAVITSK